MILTAGKIVLLTLDFPPIMGGISHYLYEIVRHVSPDKVQVIGVAAADYELFDREQSFEILRLGVPTKPHLFQKQLKIFAPFFGLALARQKEVAFIVCGQAHHSLMVPAWIVSRIKKTPFGMFAYGLDLLHPQVRVYKRVFNFLLQQVDVLFVDSSAARQIALDLGIAPSKIQVIYPSADLDELVSELSGADVRRQLGLVNKRCVLTVGRVIERKGHDVVIRALPEILTAVPDVHYMIVGSGPNKKYLQQLVSELDLDEYVSFLGYVPQTELGAYFSACDVFAMISREIPEKGDIEGFGIVYLQANLMGKPVVAGRSGGVPEAVLHEKTGLLVDPLDVGGVAEAVVRLLLDDELAAELGAYGRERVLADFSGEGNARLFLGIVDGVLYGG